MKSKWKGSHSNLSEEHLLSVARRHGNGDKELIQVGQIKSKGRRADSDLLLILQPYGTQISLGPFLPLESLKNVAFLEMSTDFQPQLLLAPSTLTFCVQFRHCLILTGCSALPSAQPQVLLEKASYA